MRRGGPLLARRVFRVGAPIRPGGAGEKWARGLSSFSLPHSFLRMFGLLMGLLGFP